MPYSTLIDPASLALLIEAGEVSLFDCSFDLADPAAGRALYRDGHVPGASYLHLEDDLSGAPSGRNGRHPLPDRTRLAAILAARGLGIGRQVVAYDATGGAFAARLWWLLRWLGHEAVAVLDGGRQAWIAAGQPLEQGEPEARAAGAFVAAPPLAGARAVDAVEIVASLDDASLLVIDARSPERFRGEPHPLDPVSGHIPGARNRFHRDNLAADGRFRPAAMLADAHHALLGGVPLERVVLQCGSGVTAAQGLLAMAIAGREGARLYPGSWSEWIADEARPIARG